jgi:uncharacterized protein (DUF2147 family)
MIPLASARRIAVFTVFVIWASPAGRFLGHAQSVPLAEAAPASPVGRWKTFDDATGKLKSIVAINQENGEVDGTIEALFDPPVPRPTCYLCSGAKKDLPLVGLQVLWGFHADRNGWSGGLVLDPETGRIYHASLMVEDGGKRLRLHGFIGIPLFGRTQYWVKAE